MTPKWLEWSQKLQSLAQCGLNYTDNEFEIERYNLIQEIASEMISYQSGADKSEINKFFASEMGHSTPKVDVRGIVFKGDEILLVKEKADGKWTVPGGWADVGSTPSENVEREIFEESGYRVKTKKVLAVYDRNKQGHTPFIYHLYKIFFLCEIIGGDAKRGIETDEVEFFAEDQLPELSTGRITEKQISRFFEHLRYPDLSTDFD
ncbi:MAG: NUDIX hydrolase [Ignavibacteria bacterium]|nr:NUDIX hydrolase [Ignavibacteria bacterium]